MLIILSLHYILLIIPLECFLINKTDFLKSNTNETILVLHY